MQLGKVAFSVVAGSVFAVVAVVEEGHHSLVVVETEFEPEPEPEEEVQLEHQSFGMGMAVELKQM